MWGRQREEKDDKRAYGPTPATPTKVYSQPWQLQNFLPEQVFAFPWEVARPSYAGFALPLKFIP